MQSSMPATGGTGWRVAVPLDTLSRHAPAKTLLDTTAHAQPEPFLSGEALAEVEATGVQGPLGAGLTSAAVGAPPPGGWYLGHCSCQPWRGELARGLQRPGSVGSSALCGVGVRERVLGEVPPLGLGPHPAQA